MIYASQVNIESVLEEKLHSGLATLEQGAKMGRQRKN